MIKTNFKVDKDDQINELMTKLSLTLEKINDKLDNKVTTPPQPQQLQLPQQPIETATLPLLIHHNNASLDRASQAASTTVLQQICTQLKRFHSDTQKDAVDRMMERRWQRYFRGLKFIFLLMVLIIMI